MPQLNAPAQQSPLSSAPVRSTRLRSRSSLLALEPRMLFDGAGTATAADQHQDAAPEASERDTRADVAVAAAPVAMAPARELLVVDPSVTGWQGLAEGAKPGTELLVLDPSRNGLEQIAERVGAGAPVSAIYVISHGIAGEVRVGDVRLNADNVATYADVLARIGVGLTADADLLIYGCDVAAGASGETLVDALARLTGADVAASVDSTGSAKLGGDWTLEKETGSIEGLLPIDARAIAAFDSLLAPVPTVTLSGGATTDPPGTKSVFIGETFSVTATFANTGPDTGYGPYLDVFARTTGADGAGAATDDGMTITGATYLGQTLTVQSIVLSATDITNGTVAHPFFRSAGGSNLVSIPSGFQAGDTLYVVQLPFGSITPGSPALPVTLNGTLSNLADLNTPLNIVSRSGFRFGADPLDNPATDPSLQGANSTIAITPTLYRVTTEYIGPENETATGPNYERQVRVTVDIANGQTLNNLGITSFMPPNATFVRVETGQSTAGGTLGGAPGIGAPVYFFNSVTGGTGANDAVFTYTFYVPEFDRNGTRVIDPASGDDVPVQFDTVVGAQWTPIDGRDSQVTISDNPAGFELTITAKSIAIQKGVAIQTNTGVAGVSPGDRLEYNLDVQVSDFFAIGNGAGGGRLLVTDVISDGQEWVAGFTPTITLSRESGGTGTFSFLNTEYTVNAPSGANGTTTVTFDVGALLARVGAGATGVSLVGDQFDYSGNDPNPQGGGATTAVIRFRTDVLEAYRVAPPGVTPAPGLNLTLNEADRINNGVDIAGTVLDSTLNPLAGGLQTEADDSSASLQIQQNAIQLDIVANNGVATTGTVRVRPGDDITYRLRYVVPTGDYENFSLTGFLPLPVFLTGDPDANGAGGPGFSQVGYAAGVFPNVTNFSVNAFNSGGAVALTPTANANGTANSLSFGFGNRDDAGNEPLTVEVFFTVRATDLPFTDELFLTALAQSAGDDTPQTQSTTQAIQQLQLAQPVLNITKGVVGDNVIEATSVFDPVYSTNTPVTLVRDAGDASGTLLRAGQTVTNGNRAILDANQQNIDAGDTVRFAIVVQNTGTSSRGAFDVTLQDDLSPGFSGATNLRLSYGDGTAIPLTAITDTSGNPFATEADALNALLTGSGIRLVDPGPNQGAIGGTLDAGGNPVNSGGNIVIITYDAIAQSSVVARSVLTSQAQLDRYAGLEGGTNFLAAPITNSASVTIAGAAVQKTIISTDAAVTSGNNVVIGERVTYEVVVSLPEGVTNGTPFSFRDILPAGLALSSIDSISASGITFAGGAFTNLGPAPLDARITVGAQGASLAIDFGAITNSNSDNTVRETVTVRYTVVATNVAGSQGETPTTLTNRVDWDGVDNVAAAPAVTVVEPGVAVTVTPSVTTVDQGDTVTYTVRVTNNGTVQLSDIVVPAITLPSGLTYTAASFVASTASGASGTVVDNTNRSATITSLAPGGFQEFTFTVTVDNGIPLGASFAVGASASGTSLPGTNNDQSPYVTNGTDTERSGAGGVNDYVATATSTINAQAVVPQLLIVDSSEASSAIAGNQLSATTVVGEIVRYRAIVQLPEGSAPTLEVRPTLPTGYAYLNDGTTAIRFIGNTAMTLPGDLAGAFGAGSTVVQPTFVLPGGRIAGGGTQTPVFTLGDITNNDVNDGNVEFVVIEFNAVVQNVLGNQETGTAQTANFLVRSGGADRGTSNTVAMTIDEPDVTIDKNLVSVVGNLATFETTVTNNAGAGATAFDVTVVDEFAGATNITLNPGSIQVIAGSANLGASDADTVSALIASLAPGQTVTIRYTGTIGNVGQVVPNRDAVAAYTSLSPTGASLATNLGGTTVTSNSGNERTGADGNVNTGVLNDYRVRDAAGTAGISGRIWEELRTDGALNSPVERLLSGITVQLIGPGNVVVETTTTDANGAYRFSPPPGTYDIVVPSTIAGGTFNGFRSNFDRDGGPATNRITVTTDAITPIADRDFGFIGPNTAPAVVSLDPQAPTYVRGTTVTIDPDLRTTDRELDFFGNYNGATLTIARQGGANPQDVFGATGNVSFAGGNLSVGATTIGTLTNTGGQVSITFNNQATPTLVADALRGITYTNTNPAVPTAPSSVTLLYTINDRNGPDPSGLQGTQGPFSNTATIVIPINTPPTPGPRTLDVTQGIGRPLTPADFSFSDPDPGASLSAVRIDTLPPRGTLTFDGVPVVPGQIIPPGALGRLVYTSPQDAVGQAFTSFNYSVRDNNNEWSVAPSTITFNVDAVPQDFAASPPGAPPVVPIMSFLPRDPVDPNDPRPNPVFNPLPTLLAPVTPVSEAVGAAQVAALVDQATGGGSAATMLAPYEPGVGAGRGLGIVPGQFVSNAVAESRALRDLNALRADTIRNPLALDGNGMLPDPTAFAPALAPKPALTPVPLPPEPPAKPAPQAAPSPGPQVESVDCTPYLKPKPKVVKRAIAKPPASPPADTQKPFTEQLKVKPKPRAVVKPAPIPPECLPLIQQQRAR